MAREEREMKKPEVELASDVFLDRGGRGLAGRGRIALLERIDAAGSITRAAHELGMSYRSAWEAIEAMDNVAGEPLIERSPGGKGGGGSRLTEAGRHLIRVFREAEAAHRRLTEQLARDIEDPERFLELARHVAFRSSARNQLVATVCGVPDEGGVTLIALELDDGVTLAASITREAIDALELAPGRTVLALVKASAISVRAPDPAGVGAGPFNVLPGKVESRTDEGMAPQLRVAVRRHLTLWGIGDASSRLQPGDAAECLIPWAAVLVVVPSGAV
jgi:molybdate transport system regulatory protein